MAYNKLLFFDKQGDPLNFAYVGPTGPSQLDSTFLYNSAHSASTKGLANVDNLQNDQIILNIDDVNSYNIKLWAETAEEYILKGAKVTLAISVLGTSNKVQGEVASISIGATDVTINFVSLVGNTFLSVDKRLYFETTYINAPGGHFTGSASFDKISSGLFENFQVFILQEFKDLSGQIIHGYPHADIEYVSGGSSKWRSRWESNNYGNVDVENIIFTYKIQENDPTGEGEPIIYNYPNVVYETAGATGDYYENGYIITSDNIEASLSLNVALNAIDVGADVYQRKLIIEELTTEGPVKLLELDFYGEVVGIDERLQVLTENLGRSFLPMDSTILRDHDPNEPLPDYIEINEKRKELMVAGEEIFPYIGSYKGLINAIKFFGYQDLRVKEYWLNIKYSNDVLTPLQTTTGFLDEYKNTPSGYSQSVLIKDVLDNPNSGKYRLTQTYGPNKDGKYVLDVSSGNTLVPSNTYRKTSFFGLYYDLLKVTDQTDPYGYPITEDAFMFSQEEVILKLFALKERLKQTYLPLNARIIDITGEGIYFNIYNTRAWTDSVGRYDIDSGFNPEVVINPDFGFIEDLRAFNTKTSATSILTPTNYDNLIELDFKVSGASGDAFRVDGYLGNNPTITLQKGNRYVIKNSSVTFPLTITRTEISEDPPYGIEGNGATAGTDIIFDVNPEENPQLYYYSTGATASLKGSITVIPPSISDLGNISNPLENRQEPTRDQNTALINAIGNFYRKKQDGEILELGDNRYDPSSYIDPITGESYNLPIGMPVIFELKLDDVIWNDLNITWDSLNVPVMGIGDSAYIKGDNVDGSFIYVGQTGTITNINYTTGVYTVNTDIGSSNFGESSLYSNRQDYSLLTWDNINFSNYVEIEWIVVKSTEQEGTPYYFSFRGPIMDYYKLAHFLPYTGKYKITCHVYDSYNFRSSKIVDEAVEVSPRTIDITAWTRYHENETYQWDDAIRTWDEYKSPWQYIAEGNTYDELRETMSYDILNFVNYGNSAYDGQNLLVKVTSGGIAPSADISFIQSDIEIVEIISNRVGSLAQYSIAEVRTATPHGFIEGSTVFIKNSLSEINGDWPISIPYGATGYTFTIPKVLVAQEGVLFNISYLKVDPDFFPNQLTSGGGEIQILIDGREVANSPADYDITSTISNVISQINKTYTTPDYVASTDTYGSSIGNIKITSSDDRYSTLNGTSLTVNVSGSLSLISFDSELRGGVDPHEEYVEWNALDKDLPTENLKWWGTKNLSWDNIGDATWDDFYGHTWDDFEYSNDWLGGFDIYGIKSGDYMMVSPGSEVIPFPIGITFFGPSGPTGPDEIPLTLREVTEQLNAAEDENITNFYFRAYPSDDYLDYETVSGPTGTVFNTIAGLTSAYPSPRTVPGANPVNHADFTYSI